MKTDTSKKQAITPLFSVSGRHFKRFAACPSSHVVRRWWHTWVLSVLQPCDLGFDSPLRRHFPSRFFAAFIWPLGKEWFILLLGLWSTCSVEGKGSRQRSESDEVWYSNQVRYGGLYPKCQTKRPKSQKGQRAKRPKSQRATVPKGQ